MSSSSIPDNAQLHGQVQLAPQSAAVLQALRKAKSPDSGSFLVRLWLEPREVAGDQPVVRGYARDLRTGEEQYFADEGALLASLRSRLAANGSCDGMEVKP